MKTKVASMMVMFYCTVGFPQFQDVSEILGVQNVVSVLGNIDGISFYDFNQDGWDDISMTSGHGLPVFLINEGGTFAPAPFEIPNNNGGQISMLLWGDVNNDGLPDLLITKYGQPVELWMQEEDYTFVNVAPESGIMDLPLFHTGAAFCDFNHDGCLDLYISKYYGGSPNDNYALSGNLYAGSCDGKFEDVTISSGVFVPPHPAFQPVFYDYNQDGWEDLLLIVDKYPWQNHLFKNNGDGTFTDVSEQTGMSIVIDAMSGTVGDYNQNGHWDVVITNTPPNGIYLMQNDGTGYYHNVAADNGLEISYTGWGALWLDYDNNTWEDLFVTETSSIPLNPQGNHFFRNSGNETFENISQEIGIWDDKIESSNCAMGDFNNDGYYDIVVNAAIPHYSRLYQNISSGNNYLSFTLQGTYSNRDAVGAKITCFANGKEYIRYVHCGENFISQNAQRKIFGLGKIEVVDSLKINWNRGLEETYYDLEVNQHLHLIEGVTVTVPFAVADFQYTSICAGDTVILDAGQHESYLWSTGDTTQLLSVTESGIYTVEGTNIYGHTVTSFPVEVQVFPLSEIEFEVSHVSCTGANDGLVALEINTGAPQWIQWSNCDSSTTIQNLSGGIYSFTASDTNGCLISGTKVIAEPSPLIAQVIPDHVTCYGDSSGSATINTLGGTAPYAANWFGANPDALAAGNYTVVIQDAHDCEVWKDVVIHQPDSLWAELDITPSSGSNNGAAEAIPHGGTPPYSIHWSTGQTDVLYLSDLDPGSYTCAIHDTHGCVYHTEFTVHTVSGLLSGPQDELRIFPNPAIRTALLEGCNPGAEITLYDVTGRVVYQQLADRCPMLLNLEHLPDGTYLLNAQQNQIQRTLRLILAR